MIKIMMSNRIEPATIKATGSDNQLTSFVPSELKMLVNHEVMSLKAVGFGVGLTMPIGEAEATGLAVEAGRGVAALEVAVPVPSVLDPLPPKPPLVWLL